MQIDNATKGLRSTWNLNFEFVFFFFFDSDVIELIDQFWTRLRVLKSLMKPYSRHYIPIRAPLIIVYVYIQLAKGEHTKAAPEMKNVVPVPATRVLTASATKSATASRASTAHSAKMSTFPVPNGRANREICGSPRIEPRPNSNGTNQTKMAAAPISSTTLAAWSAPPKATPAAAHAQQMSNLTA